MNKIITLAKGREQSVLRFHPWIFSGAIKNKSNDIKDGDLVNILDFQSDFLCKGIYQNGSICVRILSFEEVEIDKSFWIGKISNAVSYRKNILNLPNENTNCYRLMHGEGDGASGLIIDVYNKTAVVQCHNIGIHKMLNDISYAIQEVLKDEIESIYNKSYDTLPTDYSRNFHDGFIYGKEIKEDVVVENGCKFFINWVEGQKTGFFLDQRENRKLVGEFSKEKSVLNTFCYTGGFSVYAGLNDAAKITSIDISSKAMNLTDRNIALNDINNHESITQNVLEYFNQQKELEYDIVIVDPPAFAKNISKRHNAVQAYKRLNIAAMKAVKSGGLLFTFSCSQVVTTQIFYDTIVAAGIEAGRKVRVLKHLSQGPDHPVNLFHVEGHYLKGLMLEVE